MNRRPRCEPQTRRVWRLQDIRQVAKLSRLVLIDEPLLLAQNSYSQLSDVPQIRACCQWGRALPSIAYFFRLSDIPWTLE